MKVKVSYTIDLEEIPNKIKEIVKKNEDILSRVNELSQEIYTGDHGVNTLNNLTKMKQLSSDLAESYADCESILGGFLRAMFAPTESLEQSDDDNA